MPDGLNKVSPKAYATKIRIEIGIEMRSPSQAHFTRLFFLSSFIK
jgi:hypothetical protein